MATSIDGYLDDMSETRLLLSNTEDLDRVDAVRASTDAILVGANTVRRDNPRLLVRSMERQQQRIQRGRTPHPIKVTLTGCGDLDAAARFFSCGDSDKLVYACNSAVRALRKALGDAATVVAAGEPIDLAAMLDDLGERKIKHLMVEGGGTVVSQFLGAGLVNEIHLVIAPFFVGDASAPRLLHPGRFPHDAEHPMTLAETLQIGDVVLLRYLATGTGR
ncbi:MAG TPA: dihydrofolate reductase family protein [Pseudonocardiaceae bacterium]|nr:dihydrofolate reductase family protein [Pseudonocardiaceae bacterium]